MVVHENFHEAVAAGFKEIDDRQAIQRVLDNELAIKERGLGYSQHVINSCILALKDMKT